jgi:hypothetical protein
MKRIPLAWPWVARSWCDFQTARATRLETERDDALTLADERLKTITRQAAELDYFRDQNPDAPLPYPRPAEGDVELRRQLHLARRAIASLDAQLATAQQANESLTRELRQAREGVAM